MSAQNDPRDERTLRRELNSIAGRLRKMETTPRVGPVTTSELTGTGNGQIAGDFDVGGLLAVTGGVTADTLEAAGGLTLGAQTLTEAALALLLDPPYGTFIKGVTQAILDQTVTAVTGITYTATTDGYHSLTAAIPWAANPDGRREANFRVDGTTYQGSSIHVESNTLIINSLAMLVAMSAGDQAEVVVWQNSTATVNVLAGCRLEAIWRRPL